MSIYDMPVRYENFCTQYDIDNYVCDHHLPPELCVNICA